MYKFFSMLPQNRSTALRLLHLAGSQASKGMAFYALLSTLFLFAACEKMQQTVKPENGTTQHACTDGMRVLNVGFFPFFEPISYSADPDPNSDAFNTHQGYEADLLTALEAMEGTGLSFSRHAIPEWPDIWLKSTQPEYDLISGGITILDSRTRDATGTRRIIFTSGHITFQQSLLVAAEDAKRIATHADLTQDMRIATLPGTTSEARLLVLTGLANEEGTLAAGTRIETPQATLVADGTPAYKITAGAVSPNLVTRTRLYPPTENMPQIIYLSASERLEALRAGDIDAIARSRLGNLELAHASGGKFVVTALDEEVEHGGFSFALEDAELAACIDEKINYLTDNRNIGYEEWLADRGVFLERAQMWNAQ